MQSPQQMGRLFDSKAVLVPLPEGAVFLDLKVGGEPLRDSLTVYQDLELERRDGLWSGGGGPKPVGLASRLVELVARPMF